MTGMVNNKSGKNTAFGQADWATKSAWFNGKGGITDLW
jgi:hypothetical protein